jgi:hypothetical protein
MLFLFVLENMSYFTPLRIEQVKGGCSVERERPATVFVAVWMTELKRAAPAASMDA